MGGDDMLSLPTFEELGKLDSKEDAEREKAVNRRGPVPLVTVWSVVHH